MQSVQVSVWNSRVILSLTWRVTQTMVHLSKSWLNFLLPVWFSNMYINFISYICFHNSYNFFLSGFSQDAFWSFPHAHTPSLMKEEEDTIWLIKCMSGTFAGVQGKNNCLGAGRCSCPPSWLREAVGGSCLKASSQLQRQMGFFPSISESIFNVLQLTYLEQNSEK